MSYSLLVTRHSSLVNRHEITCAYRPRAIRYTYPAKSPPTRYSITRRIIILYFMFRFFLPSYESRGIIEQPALLNVIRFNVLVYRPILRVAVCTVLSCFSRLYP